MLSPRQFWRQHFRYGKGAATYWESRRRLTGSTLAVEPLGFYRDLLLYPLRHRPLPSAAVLALLITLSQIANALGFVVAARRLPKVPGATIVR